MYTPPDLSTPLSPSPKRHANHHGGDVTHIFLLLIFEVIVDPLSTGKRPPPPPEKVIPSQKLACGPKLAGGCTRIESKYVPTFTLLCKCTTPTLWPDGLGQARTSHWRNSVTEDVILLAFQGQRVGQAEQAQLSCTRNQKAERNET